MSKLAVIDTLSENKRISTQDLLQIIYDKLQKGYNKIKIHASGQHDIGGPLWLEDGKEITFYVTNPGQRLGSMGMPKTKIIVEGSAPADVGWLNSGAEIIVKGDSGDTTAHCAASGKIYIGGRVGTRSGALMKFDPKYEAPEFWVLKNTGSFSFEFMGGGTAVVCGYGCNEFKSILGSRSCVGMVGGTIYVRGPVFDVSEDVYVVDIDDKDKEFLSEGLKTFLKNIEKPDIYKELINWKEWHKIVAKPYEKRNPPELMSIKDFRAKSWVEGGIFSDVWDDNLKVSPLVSKGTGRLRIPEWQNAKECAPCEYFCPLGIPTQKRIGLIREGRLKEGLELVLEYTPFPASVCGNVCPNLCMEECNRGLIDEKIKVSELGILSKDATLKPVKITKKQKIGIIGSGSGALSCALQLRKQGYEVDVIEQDSKLGGKLNQVIPQERLDKEVLEAEIQRLKDFGINFQTNIKITQEYFEEMQKNYDTVVVATGAHNPVVIPFEGHEKLIKGLDFLKEVNNNKKVKIGKNVVVIGAGNAAMDVVTSAYKMGAKKVTAIDIQKPAAFEHEIVNAKSLGAEILWPCYTDKITDKGVVLKDGTLLEANDVIIAVGDRPDFDFVSNKFLNERGLFDLNEFNQSTKNSKIFVIGDAIKQGLFVNAMADGKNAAQNIQRMFEGLELDTFEKAPLLPRNKVKTEYYEGYPSQKVQSEQAENEKARCLSCGTCRDCEMCLNACPEHAIEKFKDENGISIYISNEERCIGCGICAGICPCGIWQMKDNV